MNHDHTRGSCVSLQREKLVLGLRHSQRCARGRTCSHDVTGMITDNRCAELAGDSAETAAQPDAAWAGDSASDDRQLLSAYVQGEEAAFESLVVKYYGMIHSVALRQVGDPHIAEEVVQSTFIILARKAGTFSREASVCGWLLRTARFVSKDALKMLCRRKKNEQELSGHFVEAAHSHSNGTVMALLLEEALLGLSAEEQSCTIARFFEGRSFKEIAEIFTISEDAAQKRVSRSLEKMRAFLVKRGIKVPVTAIPGLLTAEWAHQAGAHVSQAAIQTAHALVKGKAAGGKAIALADHALRSLSWRSAFSLSLKLALPAVLIGSGLWATRELTRAPVEFHVSDPRIENLGTAWAQLDVRVVTDRQKFLPTPPTDPRYQEVIREATAISAETVRISAELAPLLNPPDDRARVAEFLTVELSETLTLDSPEKRAVYSWIRKRLSRGATLNDALKAMAQSTQAEAGEIKAMLSPSQRQVFDQTYGADGLGLFTYAKTAAFGTAKFGK